LWRQALGKVNGEQGRGRNEGTGCSGAGRGEASAAATCAWEPPCLAGCAALPSHHIVPSCGVTFALALP